MRQQIFLPLLVISLSLSMLLCGPARAAGEITCADNALKNGGFEDGLTQTAWTISSSAGNAVLRQAGSNQAHTGEFAAFLGGQTGVLDFTTIQQPFTVPVGKTLTLQFYFRHPLSSGNASDKLEVLVDNTPEDVLADADAVGQAFQAVDLNLSPFADGLQHILKFQSTTGHAATASQWIIDDVCLNQAIAGGEGEGEGEGSNEGEIVVEGENCTSLDRVGITQPIDGSTFYLGASSGATDINVSAIVDCANDTTSIDFEVKRPSDSTALALSTDTSSPYAAVLQGVLPSGTPQAFTFTATANDKSDPTHTVPPDTSIVNIVQAGSGQDADDNGLPDDPFVTLDAKGDRWLSTGSFAGASADLIAAAYVLYGATGKTSPAATFNLTPPSGSGQSVEVDLPAGLVLSTEVGVVIVQCAQDLSSVAGTIQANLFAREPTGALTDGSAYIAVSLLVSTDSGKTFAQAPDARLTSTPIHVIFSGLTLDTTKTYTLAEHPSAIKDTLKGVQLQPVTGTWKGLTTQGLDSANKALTGDVTEFGVVAPYFIVDTTSACATGNCPPAVLWVELLAGLAFAILQFVNGGVGGGNGPCFIATAAYGTPLAHEIDTLREFRDSYLLDNAAGTAFVDLYYRVSPPIADYVASSPLLAAVVRVLLLPIIVIARIVVYAPNLAALLLFALVFVQYRRRNRKRNLDCVPKT